MRRLPPASGGHRQGAAPMENWLPRGGSVVRECRWHWPAKGERCARLPPRRQWKNPQGRSRLASQRWPFPCGRARPGLQGPPSCFLLLCGADGELSQVSVAQRNDSSGLEDGNFRPQRKNAQGARRLHTVVKGSVTKRPFSPVVQVGKPLRDRVPIEPLDSSNRPEFRV